MGDGDYFCVVMLLIWIGYSLAKLAQAASMMAGSLKAVADAYRNSKVIFNMTGVSAAPPQRAEE